MKNLLLYFTMLLCFTGCKKDNEHQYICNPVEQTLNHHENYYTHFGGSLIAIERDDAYMILYCDTKEHPTVIVKRSDLPWVYLEYDIPAGYYFRVESPQLENGDLVYFTENCE